MWQKFIQSSWHYGVSAVLLTIVVLLFLFRPIYKDGAISWQQPESTFGQVLLCGDGVVSIGEECDDSNTDDEDGCSSICEVEYDYSCVGAPSTCTLICGNGQIGNTQACDDGDVISGDGCSTACVIEAGYTCSGEPSVCYLCGNGVIEASEECDDGNAVNDDGCTTSCQVENGFSCSGAPSSCNSVCGDGTIAVDEQCDDGDATSGDGCSSTCDVESPYICYGEPSICQNNCGNGVLNFGEQCDQGGLNSNVTADRCRTDCTNFRCGDTVTDTGESCDDGNVVSNDGCSSLCQLEIASYCGDGIVDAGETCDNGVANSDTNPNACRTNCTLARCGDSVIDTGESCDDGNAVHTDGCLNTCQNAICGDNVVRTGHETCEPPNRENICNALCLQWEGNVGGGDHGDSDSSQERIYTSQPKLADEGCGNAIREPLKGEECDDGLLNGGSSCSFTCKKLKCGDGEISPQIGEECEPLAFANSDGSKFYRTPQCGEFCTPPDASKFNAADYCTLQTVTSCQAAAEEVAVRADYCGNGKIEAGEQCDSGGICNGGTYDGNVWTNEATATACFTGGGTPQPISNDGCSATCKIESCGDGKVQARGSDGKIGTSDDEDCDNGKVCQSSGDACSTNADCATGEQCIYNIFENESCNARCKVSLCQYSYEFDLTGLDLKNHTVRLTVTDSRGISAVDTTVFSVSNSVESAMTEDESNSLTAAILGFFTQKAALTNSQLKTTVSTDITHYLSGIDNKAKISCSVFDENGNRICNLPASAFALEVNGKPVPEAAFTEVDAGFCGDGVVQISEECDDGNTNPNDACTNQCAITQHTPVTTNETVEVVDDVQEPNVLPTQVNTCPNGTREGSEQCDDGNAIDGDGCSTSCKKEVRCGDGMTQNKEQCDDGNAVSGDGCSSTCIVESTTVEKNPLCGDGFVDANEACDAGSKNAQTADACRSNCTLPLCGDGIIDSGEQCDNGSENKDSVNRCRTSCMLPVCGDGIVDATEECDGSLDCTSVCRKITGAICGNSVVEESEQCDDGNNKNGDGCTSICTFELSLSLVSVCGNGYKEPGEECDDGNTNEADRCTMDCKNRTVDITWHSAPETRQLAMLIPVQNTITMVAETGPGMLGIVVTGIATGMAYIRRKRRV